ncbi:MAG: hypothetical protein L0Z62_11935 [Gemmataceae bacterium]|nr:hypothetical protein [Gemmataceae bacterium]
MAPANDPSAPEPPARDESADWLDALGRLASQDAGAYALAAPGAPPQHDRLVLTLRQLKIQEFQGLSLTLYNRWKLAKQRKEMDRTFALAHFRYLMADRILVEGSRLLSVRQTASAEGDLARVREAIAQSIHDVLHLTPQKRASLPGQLFADLQDAIQKGTEFLRAMLTAAPPGCLLVPEEGAPFTPAEHELVPDSPGGEGGQVRLTVFPGYLVPSSDRVLEKALVYTLPPS